MVQSPSWEANWFAASQEIPHISRIPKVHYRTHKRPPPVSIMGPPNPVHIPTSYLLEIHPNIIHPSMPRPPQWSLSLRLPHQDPTTPLSSPICATCPAYLILLDFITRTILGEQYKSFSPSLCNLLHSLVTSSLLVQIFSSTPCSQIDLNNIKFSDKYGYWKQGLPSSVSWCETVILINKWKILLANQYLTNISKRQKTILYIYIYIDRKNKLCVITRSVAHFKQFLAHKIIHQTSENSYN